MATIRPGLAEEVPAGLLDQVRPFLVRKVTAAPVPLRAALRAALEDALTIQLHALHRGVTRPAMIERMHLAGRGWAAAGRPVDDLVGSLGDLTACLVTALVAVNPPVAPIALANVVTAGNAVAREVLNAFRQAPGDPDDRRTNSRRQLALNLLGDRPVPVGGPIPIADAYGLLALYFASPVPSDEIADLAVQCGGEASCSMLTDHGGAVLLPAADIPAAWELAPKLHAALGGDCWMAVTWRPRGQLAAGWEEAGKVAALVAAGRPPGTYCVTHVLTEYAAAQNPSVTAGLTAVFEPLAAQPILMETLAALIAADGNRSAAAAKLIIHRSTLDYRLKRIEQLTGQNPTTTSGLHTLATARTLWMIAGQEELLLPA